MGLYIIHFMGTKFCYFFSIFKILFFFYFDIIIHNVFLLNDAKFHVYYLITTNRDLVIKLKNL